MSRVWREGWFVIATAAAMLWIVVVITGLVTMPNKTAKRLSGGESTEPTAAVSATLEGSAFGVRCLCTRTDGSADLALEVQSVLTPRPAERAQ